MIASNTIIHDSSENRMLGKIFSSLEIVMHMAFLIFMFISSLLADRIQPGNILIAVGIVVCITGACCLFINPRQWSK
ncbi:MAG TPA: hypothetical protein PLJ26_06630 [Candidatus Omnitrophota bacterium]|nr:hypothetical protein [Candidatus Omnitrophota bacterium]